MRKKILILGANGMAGHVITLGLSKNLDLYDVISVARNDSLIKPTYLLDVSNFLELESLINKVTPDIIINCIGILNKTAEENPDKAILINSYLPHFLESTTKLIKTKVIHISTDCVFSGKEGNYNEKSFKNGVGFYAQSKALGEIINDKDLTIRTSIIGPDLNVNGIGLFNWLLNQSGVINGYTRVFWSGVTTIQLAKVILEIINRESMPSGLIHLTNNKKISKFHLLSIIKNVFELKNLDIVEYKNYDVDKSFVNTRDDLNLMVPTYLEMIIEMKEWMFVNKYFIKKNNNYEPI